MTTHEPLTTAAREAIRIAEKYQPHDLVLQEMLAREIVAAIIICEEEFGDEIVRRAFPNEKNIEGKS